MGLAIVPILFGAICVTAQVGKPVNRPIPCSGG
jgi:hypothetical protein